MSFTTLHQKVVVAIIAGLTIIAISGIFAYYQKHKGPNQPKTVKEVLDEVPDSGDSDKDGAPDWQEILYGTDPAQKDTDGDGVEDKEEIDEMKRAREKSFVDVAQGNIPADITTTELAADRLVGSYIIEQQSNGGTEVSQKQKDAIIKSTIQNLSQLKYKQYTEADLRIIPDSSRSAVLTYRSQMQGKLARLKEIPEYELQIYARAVDENDPKEFAKLKAAADVYTAVASEILAIPVPNDVSEQHISFINGFMYTSAALEGMSKGYDDVIASYRALGHFGKAERQLKMAQESLRVYFTVKDIDSL